MADGDVEQTEDTPTTDGVSRPAEPAGSLSKKIRKNAKYVYDDIYHIRALFGFLDGAIISYSTFKYVFDIITPPDLSSSDAMHDWLATGTGALAASTEALAIIALSMIGNVYDEEDKIPVRRKLALFWPYFRDGFKGLKFSYKGVRSTLQTMQMMGADFEYMLLPIGLVLGVAAAANRIWYRRYVTEPRKAYQSKNNNLLKRARNLGKYDETDSNELGNANADNKYSFAAMPKEKDFKYETKTIYIDINQKEQVLKYKVINPFGELVEGKMDFIKDQNEKVISPDLQHLSDQYKLAIRKTTNENGHTGVPNTAENRAQLLEAMKKQDLPERWAAISAAIFSGFSDGLYIYMGALGLAALSPSLMTAIAACSILFTVLCVVNRYHEEYMYQQDFTRSQLNVELVLKSKDIEANLLELECVTLEKSKLVGELKSANPHDTVSIQNSIAQLEERTKILDKLLGLDPSKGTPQEEEMSQVVQFAKLKKDLDDAASVSHVRAALIGLRSGLHAYSAICSVMWAAASFCAIAVTTFPPAALVTGIVLGLVSLAVFTLMSVWANYQNVSLIAAEHQNNAVKHDLTHEESDLMSFHWKVKRALIESRTIKEILITERDALTDAMQMDHSAQYPFQESFEVIRSMCSGASKGQKAIDYPLNGLLEANEFGHYKDTPVTVSLGLVCSAAYASVYAVRAFGKNFKAPPGPDLPVHPTLRGDRNRSRFFNKSPGSPAPLEPPRPPGTKIPPSCFNTGTIGTPVTHTPSGGGPNIPPNLRSVGSGTSWETNFPPSGAFDPTSPIRSPDVDADAPAGTAAQGSP